MDNEPRIAVIGSGFAGLSSACYLAQEGFRVDVYEKNETNGGRARQLVTDNGYTFDMGPSWYWMPNVFEKFFADFGYIPTDFYELKQLDPGFSVVYGKNDVIDVPADYQLLTDLFESVEKGAGSCLDRFMAGAEFKYKIGMEKLVYNPGLSLFEFADADLIGGLFKLQVFTSFSRHVRKYFTDPRLISLMEFPVLFLGTTPQDTPALYSLMNYAGLKLGTWYPQGGFGSVISGMKTVAERLGVKFHYHEAVEKIDTNNDIVTGISTKTGSKAIDGLIAAADYQHVENRLLKKFERNYDDEYWDDRIMAPSCLIFYLGVSKKVDRLGHHTLFFDADLNQHANEIYKNPRWPADPLFYVCCPSKTDETVAPQGHENLFILMPLAPDSADSEVLRDLYFDIIMDRLEDYSGTAIRTALDYKKSYCVSDFISDYNSYKGNAYGLANTLMQTANLKPSIKNHRIKNMFYSGQLTVPGPGVPPGIISGKIAAQQLIKYFHHSHERAI